MDRGSRPTTEPVPVTLEAVLVRLGELEVLIGPRVAAAVAAARHDLLSAIAARDRGDPPGAAGLVGAAMQRLAVAAEALDPAEAGLMRLLAHGVESALRRGNVGEARRHAAEMFEKSGAVEIRKP